MRLCIDLGATSVKGALAERGVILKTASASTRHGQGREGIVASLEETIETLLCPRVQTVCIASAGDIDGESGVCTYATGNLENFSGFDFPAFVRGKYGLPCRAANDAYCALLGELYFGAAKELRSLRVAMLTLGSGVGGAYWDGVRAVAEASSGEKKLGHLILHENGTPCNCGKRGCIEQYLSGRAINRLARAHGLPSDGLFPALNAGQKSAYGVGKIVADDLKAAAEVVGKEFPFDVLLLGGGVAESIGESLAWLREETGLRLAVASLGNRAGVMGAYCLAEDFA